VVIPFGTCCAGRSVRSASSYGGSAVGLPPGRLSQMGRHPSGPNSADVDLRDARVRRRMLTEGPVGEWVTLPGTHTALIYDVIRFAPDGTGEIRGDSTLGGETVEHFTWSVARPGLLTCVVTDATWMPAPDMDDDPEPDETQKVGFQFEEQHSDVGTFWVMCDSDRDGFWNLAFPVVPRPSRREGV
jgi:hypothetical protein